jgi:hypothetical protein
VQRARKAVNPFSDEQPVCSPMIRPMKFAALLALTDLPYFCEQHENVSTPVTAFVPLKPYLGLRLASVIY